MFAKRSGAGAILVVLALACLSGACRTIRSVDCTSPEALDHFKRAPFTVAGAPGPVRVVVVEGEKPQPTTVNVKLDVCKCTLCKCGGDCKLCEFRVSPPGTEGVFTTDPDHAWEVKLDEKWSSDNLSVTVFFCGCKTKETSKEGACDCAGPLPSSSSKLTLKVNQLEPNGATTACPTVAGFGYPLKYYPKDSMDKANILELLGYVVKEVPALSLLDSRGRLVPSSPPPQTIETVYDPTEMQLPGFTTFELKGSKSVPLHAGVTVTLMNTSGDAHRLSTPGSFEIPLDGTAGRISVRSQFRGFPPFGRRPIPPTYRATLTIKATVRETGAAFPPYVINLVARPQTLIGPESEVPRQ